MKKTHLTLRLFRDKKREFRWTLIASNGRKLADSGEGYKRKPKMENAATFVIYGGDCDFVSLTDALEYRPDIQLQDDTAPTPHHRCKPNARC